MHTRLLVDAATAAMYIEPMTARHVGPWYHETCFSAATLRETAKAVAETLARLKSYFPELQAVAGSGHSGSVLVGALSATTDFNPILVRKEGEIQVAGGGQVSGMLGEFDYVIVDDLVSSGSTVRRIVSKIKETAKKAGVTEPRCVAIVTYNGTNKEVDAGWDILPAIDVRQHDLGQTLLLVVVLIPIHSFPNYHSGPIKTEPGIKYRHYTSAVWVQTTHTGK